ncbi:S-adenosylmethionine-dependent methyltransferase-like protein [Pleurostoma richardsiae]|uniref:S-adenosylmethionine-dependent methyltransferase-like protein n=1 Tax=Pleurostoma richardsiae TaxID=41990 RepID=A0AA38R837_9PEZI|nr:S-adenosylmethionine-dependent methyltransferase-like protein [Pleurostoma richardsiae]
MPFGRTGRQNNRSQHALVEPSAAASSGPGSAPGAAPSGVAGAGQSGGITPSSASSTTALSSSESFDLRAAQQQQQQQQASQPQPQPPAPPPHAVNVFGAGNSANGSNLNSQRQQQPFQPTGANSNPSIFDARQQKAAQDFADSVARSQSQRYPQVTPIQTAQQHYGIASSSVDDLPATLHHGQPAVPQLHHQSPHQQQAPPPPEPKRSTRRLIKNILSGSGSSSSRGSDQQQQHGSQSSYDNTAGLARRPSKRVSNSNPLALRTGASQVSLEQQPLDWPSQGTHTQPSPLQGVGELNDLYSVEESNREITLQTPQHNIQQQHPSIRRVPTQHESSPYSPDENTIAYQQQQAHLPQLQGQVPPEHRQFGQVTFDPATQQYQFSGSPQTAQYQGGNQQVYGGHLGTNSPQNPETVSQLSHESPLTESDPPPPANIQSASTQNSPAVNYPAQVQDSPVRQAAPGNQQSPQQQSQQSPQQQQQQAMAPPPGGPPPNRRSQEADKSMRGQVEPPPGPPPSYRQSQHANMNPLPPPPPSAGGANPNYRQNTAQDRQQQFEGAGEGRNSPQPSASDRDGGDPEKAFKELLTKYKNVKRLYFDGKTQVEQLTSQVEQLQNAIANQRMSQSRTSLDDNEYTTRFNRLNGAINNLSFNIRKDWVTLPSWLDRYVSTDALKTGKQEMTAVGRAIITRWVAEEIFGRCFHPGLDPELSRQLKEIEQNIRRFSYTMNSQEEYDALTSKVVSWRMATLEGLQRVLQSPESASHRQDFTRRATTNLTACLFQHLTEPPPAGVDGSASMIVELAVGIASNLPLESRDVAITYPLPLDPVQPDLMDVEKTGLPPIETRGDGEADDEDSGGSGKDAAGGESSSGKSGKDRKSRSALPPKDPTKVRFAGFVAVEVRGRQVLVKAPVWTLG